MRDPFFKWLHTLWKITSKQTAVGLTKPVSKVWSNSYWWDKTESLHYTDNIFQRDFNMRITWYSLCPHNMSRTWNEQKRNIQVIWAQREQNVGHTWSKCWSHVIFTLCILLHDINVISCENIMFVKYMWYKRLTGVIHTCEKRCSHVMSTNVKHTLENIACVCLIHYQFIWYQYYDGWSCRYEYHKFKCSAKYVNFL